ncbi:Septum formation initiator [Bacteroides luti]|uniref:Septum formation initiator n=1 Tax=Bacteroides luti TaxID=1297750 RepID=A0A1M5CR76_9BACE|nr:septum formation initiator family protein [Bacteroides luti]SHF57271.1 Septum formation initiator [Bacteroides luti]
MSKLHTIWEFIRRHKYLITILIFVTIIGFLDENSMVRRISNIRKINKLHESIREYQADYDENTKRLNELTTNPRSIEKVAREKYLMKKPNEDIYIIQDDEQDTTVKEEPQK